MNDTYSAIAANAIANAAINCQNRFYELCGELDRPSVLFRPKLSLDGDKWIALYGDNLQESVVGIGDSPSLAMWDFDKAWCQKKGGAT